MKTKLFITGPTAGRQEFNQPAFREAEKLLSEEGYECHHAYQDFKGIPLEDPPVGFLQMTRSASVCKLAGCDALILLPDWKFDEASKTHEIIARHLALPIIEMENLIEHGRQAITDALNRIKTP